MRNIDLPSNSRQHQTEINLSKKLRNLYVFFYEKLNFKYQVAAIKKKVFGGLINI